MARRTFFSFHYQLDVSRAFVVRNSWITARDREAAGFFDASVFESKKRESDEVLKRFLREGLEGSSVVCALTGFETASRRWVRYEILQALRQGRGLMEIAIHSIRCMRAGTACAEGASVLANLGFIVTPTMVGFCEMIGGNWQLNPDVPSLPRNEFRIAIPGDAAQRVVTLDRIFPRYDWNAQNGYMNMGAWIESAARQVGR
jgi:hypothetical protein